MKHGEGQPDDLWPGEEGLASLDDVDEGEHGDQAEGPVDDADIPGWPRKGTKAHADFWLSWVEDGLFFSDDPDDIGEEREEVYEEIRSTAGPVIVRFVADPAVDWG